MKAIIFDVDGTMLDTERAQLKALQQVLEQHDLMYTMDELRVVFGIPGKDALKRLGVENINEVHKEWDKAVEVYMDEVQIFYGVEEALKTLTAQGVKLGIVTSKTRVQFVNEFQPFGLNDYFASIITAEDAPKTKPDPAPLQLCLTELAVAPAEAIYVGDTIFDYQCAKGAGVPFALALWGAHSTKGMDDAAYRLETAEEITNIIV